MSTRRDAQGKLVRSRPALPPLRPILQELPEGWNLPRQSAFVHPSLLLPQGEDEHSRIATIPWAPTAIVLTSSLTSGSLGNILISSAINGGIGPVPKGYRAVLDGIYPYLEGPAGPIYAPRIVGPGVAIVWHLNIDNNPNAYSNITTLLSPWGAPTNPRPIAEIRRDTNISVTVDYTDPGGLYTAVGVRLMGRWIPYRKGKGEV